MSDYIKREDAIVAVEKFGGRLNDEVLYEMKSALFTLSNADVVEVRHAKDIGYESSYGWKDVCSLCGCEFVTSKGANYCPNCGARMDRKEQENE